MTSLLLAGLQMTFSFPGGSAADFVAKVHTEFEKPVCLLIDRSLEVRKVSVAAESRNDAFAQLIKRLGLSTSLSADTSINECRYISLSPAAWPIDLYYRGYGRSDWDSLVRPDWSPAADVSKRATVKVNMTREDYATMQDVRELLVTETGISVVQWHWFFDKVEVAIAAVDIDRESLARMVAASIGARLIWEKNTAIFELDPNVMRARVLALKDHEPKIELFTKARRNLDAVVYGELSDEQVVSVWRDSQSFITIQVPEEGLLREAVDGRMREISGGTDATSWRDAARSSIGKEAIVRVDAYGVSVLVKQANGQTYAFR